jgi:hypothetical protein
MYDILLRCVHSLGRDKGEKGAKEEVLDDGELAEDLGLVHLAEALVDLGPPGDAGDVGEERGMFPERSFLDLYLC